MSDDSTRDGLAPEMESPALLDALTGIAVWRERAEQEANAAVNELRAEEARLTASIAELKRRLVLVEERRAQTEAKLGQLDDEELLRSHQALLSALSQDQALLVARSGAIASLRAAAKQRAEVLLRDDELQGHLREFASFAEVEVTLKSLPPGYRKAILAHHDTVRRVVEPVLRELRGDTVALTAPHAPVALIASVEPSEGPPQALVLLTPVSADLQTAWDQQPQDLCASVAYRVMAAAAEIAARLGAADAPVQARPYGRFLAFQIWLRDRPVKGDVKEIATAALQRAKEQARDLAAAQVELFVLWLPAAVLSPPEDDEDDSSVDEDTEDEALRMIASESVADDRFPDFLIADPDTEA